MAAFTIHPWDKVSNTDGAARLLRDHADFDIKEAKKVIEHCKAGASKTVQVPFAKRPLLSTEFKKKGFPTS